MSNQLPNLIFVVSILDFGERNHPCRALQVVASQAVRSQAHRTSLPETPKTSEASGETLRFAAASILLGCLGIVHYFVGSCLGIFTSPKTQGGCLL